MYCRVSDISGATVLAIWHVPSSVIGVVAPGMTVLYGYAFNGGAFATVKVPSPPKPYEDEIKLSTNIRGKGARAAPDSTIKAENAELKHALHDMTANQATMQEMMKKLGEQMSQLQEKKGGRA